MINHARTLLLNRPASFNAGLQNTVYIPEDYSPVVLPPDLVASRDAIIPPTNSKQNELDVVNVVMGIVHSPDLLPYVLKFDNRITYAPQSVTPASLATGQVGYTMTQSMDCDVVPHYKFVNHSVMVPVTGRYTWTIMSVDAQRVRVTNTKGMTENVVLNLNSASTTSLPLNIIPGYLTVYFGLPSKEFTGTFRVNYTLDVRTSYDMVSGFANMQNALIARSSLFDSANDADVVPVLRDTWLHNPAYVTRYGAAVLAHIYAVAARVRTRS